jgi:archaellin
MGKKNQCENNNLKKIKLNSGDKDKYTNKLVCNEALVANFEANKDDTAAQIKFCEEAKNNKSQTDIKLCVIMVDTMKEQIKRLSKKLKLKDLIIQDRDNTIKENNKTIKNLRNNKIFFNMNNNTPHINKKDNQIVSILKVKGDSENNKDKS